MKFLSIIIFLLTSSKLIAQPKVEFTTLKNKSGVEVYVSNLEYSPVSAYINFSLVNMNSSIGNNSTIVIPSNTNNFLIAELKIIDSISGYKYAYDFKTNFGDVTITTFDTNYVYDLPFKKGTNYKVIQGYNGNFSHQTENAIDFLMPEGTEFTAARDGIVITVIQNNTKFCSNKNCVQYNNYINILHCDGTFANYSHLQYMGSKVNVGDKVKQGEIIGLSGNTGFTSGPHLHFRCYLPKLEDNKSIETYFKINDGNDIVKLLEKENYYKNY